MNLQRVNEIEQGSGATASGPSSFCERHGVERERVTDRGAKSGYRMRCRRCKREWDGRYWDSPLGRETKQRNNEARIYVGSIYAGSGLCFTKAERTALLDRVNRAYDEFKARQAEESRAHAAAIKKEAKARWG